MCGVGWLKLSFMFKLLPPSTKIYWEMCFMSSAGSYQKQWITIHNRCRAVWKKYCWLFTKERNILYILRTIKLHCAAFCPFLSGLLDTKEREQIKLIRENLGVSLYSFGFYYLLILLAIDLSYIEESLNRTRNVQKIAFLEKLSWSQTCLKCHRFAMEVKYESFLKHGKQRRLDRRHLPRGGGVDPMELILSV